MSLTRALRLLGYVLFIIVGLGALVRPALHLHQRLAIWLVAYLVFGLAFHLGARKDSLEARRTPRLLALLVQPCAMLAMAGLEPCRFGALSLVIVAWQVALLFRPVQAGLWIAGQTIGVAACLLPSYGIEDGLAAVIALA